jgi:uncharacterized protein YecT (DUF1311 family)
MCRPSPRGRVKEVALNKTSPHPRGARLAARAGLIVLLAAASAGAQTELDPDPCAHAHGAIDVGACWAREAERAEDEMNGAYETARHQLPGRAAESLEKAQKLWREFLEAHLRTLYGVESPTSKWGRDFPICLSISRTTLIRARTREIRRLLEPDEDTICPL